MHLNFLLGGDCGRGFSLIENVCVNLSVGFSNIAGMDSKCQEIGATVLTDSDSGFIFVIKVR
jgi:hypothetical protein